jgi:single-strand DNA-binding protein
MLQTVLFFPRLNTFAKKIESAMALEIEGVMHRIFDKEQKTASFQFREFVIEVPDGNYPQMAKFQIVQDRVNLLDAFAVGERVKVHFDLRGREWQGKYFTTLNAWKIDKLEQSQTATPAEQRSATPVASAFPLPGEEPPATDDLPF